MAPRSLRQLTEAQIKKAEVEGKLKGLKGEGEPLPNRIGDAFLDAGDVVGHRMMAEAGALPEEILLKRDVAAAKEAYQNASDAEKHDAMAKLAELELKLAIAQEARRKFLR